MPCGKCGAVPPYPDGSWTQKHRLKPGSKGGRYTVKNTVPRCPKCHAFVEHKGVGRGLIMLSLEKRRAAGRKHKLRPDKAREMARRCHELHPDLLRRHHELYPDLASQTMRRTNRRYPNLASEAGKKGGLAATVAMRAKYTPEQLSALKRTAGVKSNHLRWHVRRGIRNPNCPLCTKGGTGKTK
jgi:hypothetical protein